jgi:uncharacterized protein YraI
MKRPILFAIASLAAAAMSLLVPTLAHAADAYVTGNVNLRAGPDPSYPLIDQIPAGTEVDVQGCTDGWEWCDVIVYGDRGWVAGNFIEYEYQDGPVLLPAYGAQIGIPIITFVIRNYWDHYYRDRPFYRERDRWYSRPVVRRPPPPPIGRPYRGRPEMNDDYRPDQRRDSRENRPVPGYQDSGRREPANQEHAVHIEQAGRPPQRGSEPGPHPGNQRGPVQGPPPAHGHGRSQGKPAQHRDDRDKRDSNDDH